MQSFKEILDFEKASADDGILKRFISCLLYILISIGD